MEGIQANALVRRAAGGDTHAFRTLFEAHHEALYRLAYRLTSSPDAAEDITQECFLRLVGNPGFDHARGSLRQYLYGTVRNLVRQRWQAGGREVPWDDESEDGAPAVAAAFPDAMISAEVSDMVQAALAALPALQREAIVLFELEELSLEETATVAGTDVGTVKSRLYRARERLRRSLSSYRVTAQKGTRP